MPELPGAHLVIERAIFLEMLQAIPGSLMATRERPVALEVIQQFDVSNA